MSERNIRTLYTNMIKLTFLLEMLGLFPCYDPVWMILRFATSNAYIMSVSLDKLLRSVICKLISISIDFVTRQYFRCLGCLIACVVGWLLELFVSGCRTMI